MRTIRTRIHAFHVKAGGIRACRSGDAGMNTAEYAVGTLAAVAFAGVLLKVVTSENVRNVLTNMIVKALG